MYSALLKYSCWPLLALLLLGQPMQAQNLVPNPSFEDVNTCSEFDQPCSPSAWFYLSRRLTTGYFPRFPSATGSRHLQLVAASRQTVDRQYWETMLLCPLEAGERYTITMKVASPRNARELGTNCPNLRDIGLWFTTQFIFVQGDSILQPRSYFSFAGAAVKNLKNGWFELSKEYVSPTHSAILILGNFARADNVDIMDQRNIPGPSIDILADDLSIVRVNGTICPNYSKVKDSLYAILRRHSDKRPGEPDPEIAGTPPGTRPETLPEPRPVADTPKPGQRPPATDTIVIHNIQFDFDKYLVQHPDTLQQYRRLLARPGIKRILVIGFTDDTGTEAYNLDLSQKRAREVARLLAAKFDIAPGLIESEGRGISTAYPTKDLNRRVEIYIFHE